MIIRESKCSKKLHVSHFFNSFIRRKLHLLRGFVSIIVHSALNLLPDRMSRFQSVYT